MYQLLILSVVVMSALAERMDNKLCGRVFHPNAMLCCQKISDSLYKINMTDDLSACFQVSKDPITCEREICIAQKKGFATDDKKLDKKKLEEIITKDFGSDVDLLGDVKSKCLNGAFNKYAPPDFCDFMKMKHCVSMQMLNHCPEWHSNAECQEIKGLVAECVKIIT